MGEGLTASDINSASPSAAITTIPEESDEDDGPPTPTPKGRPLPTEEEPPTPVEKDTRLRFTTVMNSLKKVYPEEALRDISTSYGFICLLHLANEKGLVLQGGDPFGDGDDLEEIYISKDVGAVVEEGAA